MTRPLPYLAFQISRYLSSDLAPSYLSSELHPTCILLAPLFHPCSPFPFSHFFPTLRLPSLPSSPPTSYLLFHPSSLQARLRRLGSSSFATRSKSSSPIFGLLGSSVACLLSGSGTPDAPVLRRFRSSPIVEGTQLVIVLFSIIVLLSFHPLDYRTSSI